MIPYATVTDWELGHRKMPEYVLRMMAYQVKMEGLDQISEEERKKLERRGRKPKNAEETSFGDCCRYWFRLDRSPAELDDVHLISLGL